LGKKKKLKKEDGVMSFSLRRKDEKEGARFHGKKGFKERASRHALQLNRWKGESRRSP